MADTVQISRLSSTLDECLSKIERLGVSLKDLKSNEAVLADFESALDDIQKKKDTLLGSSAADSVKQQVGDLMRKLQDAMGSGANLSSLFGSINRIRDLARSGGESLPSFSPSARARYQDVSDSYAAAGFGRGGAPQSGLVRSVRSVITDVPSGTSASYGGMNAFMSTRALAMGDALSGYNVRESSRSLSQQLADETQSDVMEDSVATIQRTSDEILDVLQRPREVKGSVKAKTTVKREVQKRDGGFSWGGLLKTVGTVGLIGGALFGALGSETVSQWLVDMTDPKKREEWINKQKEWFEKKWNEFKPEWDAFKNTLSEVWDTVSKLGSYLVGFSKDSLETMGTSAYKDAAASLSMKSMAYVERIRASELRAEPIEVKGVSGDISDRARDLLIKGVGSAGMLLAGEKISVRVLKALYRGGSLALSEGAAAALSGTGAALLGPAAVGTLLLGIAGAVKDDAEREALNSMSAQAAIEAHLPFFYAYVKNGGSLVQPVPFFRLSDGKGGMYGASLSDEAQRGLILTDIAATKHLLDLSNERTLVDASQKVIEGEIRKARADISVAQMGGGDVDAAMKRHQQLSALLAEVGSVLRSGSAEDVTAMLSKLDSLGYLPQESDLHYEHVPVAARHDILQNKPGVVDRLGSPTLKFVEGVNMYSPWVDIPKLFEDGKYVPTMAPGLTNFKGLNSLLYGGLLGWSKMLDGLGSWFGYDLGMAADFVLSHSPRYRRPTSSTFSRDKRNTPFFTDGTYRDNDASGTPFPARVPSPKTSAYNDFILPILRDMREDLADEIVKKLEEKEIVSREQVSASMYNSSTLNFNGKPNDQQQGFQ